MEDDVRRNTGFCCKLAPRFAKRIEQRISRSIGPLLTERLRGGGAAMVSCSPPLSIGFAPGPKLSPP